MTQEIVPSKYRHTTIGLFDASSLIAQLMPLSAWAIIKNTGNWRNCYYLMIGFQIINFAFLFLFYHPPSFQEKQAQHGKSKRQLLSEFDWIGLFMFVAGCTLFIVGVGWGGTLFPWKSATTLAPIIIGFMTLVALGFYEAFGNLTEPLFPPRLFKAVRQYVISFYTEGNLANNTQLYRSYICNGYRWNAILLECDALVTHVAIVVRYR